MRLVVRVFLLLLAPFLFATVAVAAPAWSNYTPQSFARAQAAGKTIIVDVYADWCPTCKAQHPVLEDLRAEKQLQDAALFRVNFDVQKDFLRQHRIPRQSTILVFKGSKETGRSIAETDRDKLRAFILGAAH